VFSAIHIWRKRSWRSFAAAWLSVVATLLFIAPSAQAAGESYAWKDAAQSAIVAKDGNYTGTVTFNKTGDGSYTANASYKCPAPSGDTKTSQLTVSLTTDQLKAIPSQSTLKGAPANCDFKTNPLIDTPAGTDVTTGDTTPAAGTKASDDDAGSCDQGSLTWLACPIIDNISKAITSLAKDVLVPLLEVNTITKQSTPELYQFWASMRDLTQVFFILIFFVIIAATMLQQDIAMFNQYTIKKTLPRLVIASILVQFSFLICGLIVDVGNVLGAGIQQLLASVFTPDSGNASFTNVLGNIGALTAGLGIAGGAALVLASWTVALPILLSLMLSLLTVFLTLGARFLLIAILVGISPLAFLAWVLPGTEDFFHDWHKLFTKLVLMYPLIVLVLTLAGYASQLMGADPGKGTTANGFAATAVALIKPLIVIAAFLIIPMTFRFAGKSLQRVHGFLDNASQKAKGGLQNSQLAERGRQERQARQNKLMGNVMNSKAVTSLGSSNSKIKRGAAAAMTSTAAMALMKAPNNRQRLEASNSALRANMRKEMETLDESKNPFALKQAVKAYAGRTQSDRDDAYAKTLKDAPNLLRYGKTAAGRQTMLEMLRDMEFLGADDMDQFLETNQKRSMLRGGTANLQGEYVSIRNAMQSKRKIMPGYVLRMDQAKAEYKVEDLGGETIRTIRREVGDVDINQVMKSYSKMNASHLSQKHIIDNFDVLKMAADTSATPLQVKTAHEVAQGMARGIDANVLTQVFDAKNRNALNTNTRIAAFEGFSATHADWRAPELRTKVEAALTHIDKDNDVSEALAVKAQMDKSVYDSLSHQARLIAVREFVMNGAQYQSSRDYEADAAHGITGLEPPTTP
jgi:hypothetical protein